MQEAEEIKKTQFYGFIGMHNDTSLYSIIWQEDCEPWTENDESKSGRNISGKEWSNPRNVVYTLKISQISDNIQRNCGVMNHPLPQIFKESSYRCAMLLDIHITKGEFLSYRDCPESVICF
jgi:hypothetical protein